MLRERIQVKTWNPRTISWSCHLLFQQNSPITKVLGLCSPLLTEVSLQPWLMELKILSFSDTSHFNWMLLKSPKYSWCREINIFWSNSRHSDGTEEMRFRSKGTFCIPQLPTCYIMTLKCVHSLSLSHTHACVLSFTTMYYVLWYFYSIPYFCILLKCWL